MEDHTGKKFPVCELFVPFTKLSVQNSIITANHSGTPTKIGELKFQTLHTRLFSNAGRTGQSFGYWTQLFKHMTGESFKAKNFGGKVHQRTNCTRYRLMNMDEVFSNMLVDKKLPMEVQIMVVASSFKPFKTLAQSMILLEKICQKYYGKKYILVHRGDYSRSQGKIFRSKEETTRLSSPFISKIMVVPSTKQSDTSKPDNLTRKSSTKFILNTMKVLGHISQKSVPRTPQTKRPCRKTKSYTLWKQHDNADITQKSPMFLWA
ncbi:hypothetical protein Tco_0618033 [Tanacetum coccineum]